MVVLLILFCVIAAVAILYSVASYNKVVRRDAQADVARGHIRSLVTRQSDLVSQLATSARVYGAADDQTITEVEHRLREEGASKGTTERLEASEALSKATMALIDEVRGSEDAMASTAFVELIAEIEKVEEQISVARADHTACVDAYNSALAAFPASIICGPRFRPRKGGTPKDAA